MVKMYADLKVKDAQALLAKGPGAFAAMSSLEGLQIAQQSSEWEAKLPEKAKTGEPAKLRQKEARKVFGTIGQLDEVQGSLHTSVTGAVGAAFVAAKLIPAKVGPLIRSVMESVQKEQQVRVGYHAAHFSPSYGWMEFLSYRWMDSLGVAMLSFSAALNTDARVDALACLLLLGRPMVIHGCRGTGSVAGARGQGCRRAAPVLRRAQSLSQQQGALQRGVAQGWGWRGLR